MKEQNEIKYYSLTYETRCRRCGNIEEWAFGTSNQLTDEDWKKLHFWVSEHLNIPSVSSCSVCKKNTIQDYVSYSDR